MSRVSTSVKFINSRSLQVISNSMLTAKSQTKNAAELCALLVEETYGELTCVRPQPDNAILEAAPIFSDLSNPLRHVILIWIKTDSP
jgi:hypothetical protein